jgi:hypothetical protein
MLNESTLIKLFAGIFLLRRLESCAATGKAEVMVSKTNNISLATLKQTIL